MVGREGAPDGVARVRVSIGTVQAMVRVLMF